jgi:hypothetical protein
MRLRRSTLVLGALAVLVLALSVPGSVELLRAGAEGAADLLLRGILLDAVSQSTDDRDMPAELTIPTGESDSRGEGRP